jgi:hypothetical protein
VGIRKGEYWRCQNQVCQGEILVTASSALAEDRNPLCSCGSLMKKPYIRPALKSHPATGEITSRFEGPASHQLAPYPAQQSNEDNN